MLSERPRERPRALLAAASWSLLLALSGAGCSKQAPPGESISAASGLSGRSPAAAAGGPSVVAVAVAASPAAALPVKFPQTEVTWSYADTPVGPMNAVVVVPERAADARFPVLVTFHGTGEARKGPEKGARGWLDDYGMLKAIARLEHPPLTNEDLEGFADPERL